MRSTEWFAPRWENREMERAIKRAAKARNWQMVRILFEAMGRGFTSPGS